MEVPAGVTVPAAARSAVEVAPFHRVDAIYKHGAPFINSNLIVRNSQITIHNYSPRNKVEWDSQLNLLLPHHWPNEWPQNWMSI